MSFVLHSIAYQFVINTCLGLLGGSKRSFVDIAWSQTHRVKMLISKYLGQVQLTRMLLNFTLSSMEILVLVKNALWKKKGTTHVKDNHYNHLLGWHILESIHPMFKHVPLPKFESVQLEMPPELPHLIYRQSPQPILVGCNHDDGNNFQYIRKCKCPPRGYRHCKTHIDYNDDENACRRLCIFMWAPLITSWVPWQVCQKQSLLVSLNGN